MRRCGFNKYCMAETKDKSFGISFEAIPRESFRHDKADTEEWDKAF